MQRAAGEVDCWSTVWWSLHLNMVALLLNAGFSTVILTRDMIKASSHGGGGSCSSSLFQALVLSCIYSLINQSSSTGHLYYCSLYEEFKAN